MGIVAGLGVAGLPLTSYAANTASVTVGVTVTDSIAITAGASNVDLTGGTPGSVATGSTTITVVSNKTSGYKIQASGTELTSSSLTAIPFGTTANAKGSKWGVRIGTSGEYTGAGTLKTTTAASAVAGDTYTVEFGATIGQTQENGTYSGSVTFTASNNA